MTDATTPASIPNSNRVPAPLPLWRGFNLLQMFAPPSNTVPNIPLTVPLPFLESDFRFIADNGFNFVRIPMSYWYWSCATDYSTTIPEWILETIDQAVDLGKRYGIHVSLCMHRTPGWCVNPPEEPYSLWGSRPAPPGALNPLEASCNYWSILAKRYKDIPSSALSFDLINEPPPITPPPTPPMPPTLWDVFDNGMESFLANPKVKGDTTTISSTTYQTVVNQLTNAIRSVSPERLVIAEGLGFATQPPDGLNDLPVAFSCHCYEPLGVSQYGNMPIPMPAPTWPGGWQFVPTYPPPPPPPNPPPPSCPPLWDQKTLATFFAPWEPWGRPRRAHLGETGCYNQTPHPVALAWLEDVLRFFTTNKIGYALWQLTGPFGILNSGRADVTYERLPNGVLLDRKMLELLKRY
jgi:endoglucanase